MGSSDGNRGAGRARRGRLGAGLLALAVILSAAVVGLTAEVAIAATTGELTQKAGTAGCVSDTGTTGTCQDGTALDGAEGVAVSPDGKSVYVASFDSDSVSVFDRDPATGGLVQKAGVAGCVSDSGSGPCQDGSELNGAQGVAVSPDGASVYVTSGISNSVTTFNRNLTTGELTQRTALEGCISESGSGGACQDGRALGGANRVVVSPDGTSVYVSSGSFVAVFDRNISDGVITQKALTEGCVSNGASSGCAVGVGLADVHGVTVSPDGTSVYAAAFSSDAVTIFDRSTSTGALTQKPGTAGCIAETGDGVTCADGAGLDGANGVTVSPNGASVYVASGSSVVGPPPSGAVAILDRSPAGALTQKPAPNGCISEFASGGACQDTGQKLRAASAIVVSPDGKSAYVVSNFAGAVTIFDRAATGALSQKAGTAGCITTSGSGGTCQDGSALVIASGIAISPDGRSVYAAAESSDAVSIFDRETGGTSPGDTTPPQTTITKFPKKKAAELKVKVKFKFKSDEAGSTFQCKLDKKKYKPCTSPRKYTVKVGKHKFLVRAIDRFGNVDPTPARKRFKVRQL